MLFFQDEAVIPIRACLVRRKPEDWEVRFRHVTMAACIACAFAAPAMAQDMVVMRRHLVPGAYSTHEWRSGSWMLGAPTCSETAVQTRTTGCVETATGAPAAPSLCRGAPPPSTQTAADYRTCTYAWTTGTYSYASACADSTTATRSVDCQRRGASYAAIKVDDASCTSARPDATQTVSNYAGCDFAWTKTDQACVSDGVRAVRVACMRSGGTSTPSEITDGAGCAAALKPAASRADATCVMSATCGMPQGGTFRAGGTASYDIRTNVTTAAQAQAACNAFLAGTSRKGVCFWDSNSNVYGVGKESGPVSFYENASTTPTPSYPQFYASVCTKP